VVARWTVGIEGGARVRLSSGTPVAQGEGWAGGDGPGPKPAYLFALGAGTLVAHRDRFTTASGRDVALAVWVRPGDEAKCAYAMDALKRSMRWDEEVYGREYDLDVFNIVAVDDFNMGAMENKGLNIFNSKYVLASPETATDRDYELIEGIVAHEYFHNWTGNRITCRDWFQLCLKEGLTVYRDQQFTGDMRSHAVKRIDDVLGLRASQFREDAGPLAHPVRPEEYIEINNFYTSTVYEKGAEVIGMLHTLVGAEGYAKALGLYFDRHDGQACTIEDWIKAFEDATGRDLTQFALWYSQAGTPRVTVETAFNAGTLTLTLRQETPPTPGQPEKRPLVIPLAVGLLDPDGAEVRPTQVLELVQREQTITFAGLEAAPLLSLNRGFSAPIILVHETSRAERAFLLAHDTDPFNRWEAGRALAKEVLVDMVRDRAAPDPALAEGLGRVASDDSLDPAFRALALGLPSQDDMAQTLFDGGTVPDPIDIRACQRDLFAAIAEAQEPVFAQLYDEMTVPGPYRPDAASAGRRALRLCALGFLAFRDGGNRAADLFATADNMTEQLGALSTLLFHGRGAEELTAFESRWRDDRLVMDKWFSLQVVHAAPGDAVATATRLTEHPDFVWTRPNRFRAVVGALTANTAGFHHPSGAGYASLADWLIKLDTVNPQTTAGMTTAFETWRRYDADRQAMMRAALERIGATAGLSRDTGEMVSRLLGNGA